MWICLIGPPTCKQNIAKDLSERSGYRHSTVTQPRFAGNHPEMVQYNFLDQYFRQNLEMQDRMSKEDLVTISSFWCQHEVYAKALHMNKIITDDDFELSEKFYKRLSRHLEPPSCFIYLTGTHIEIRSRLGLKNEDEGSEEWVEAVRTSYDEFVKKIRVPVIEIDGGKPYSSIWGEVDFDIAQMKTTRLSDQTLWTRTIFHSGRV